jgi:hypothetical protein
MGSVLPLEVVTGWFYDCILLHLREVGDVANDICAICFHNTSYNEFVNLVVRNWVLGELWIVLSEARGVDETGVLHKKLVIPMVVEGFKNW